MHSDAESQRAVHPADIATDTSFPHPRIAVIATGGTIACTADATAGGALVPTLSAADLVERARDAAGKRFPLAGIDCSPVDTSRLDSSSLTFADLDGLVATIARELAKPETTGVVVTHGTDSMEDTALALDLFFGDSPVVLTGAQRPADSTDPDGPANLAHAIAAAADRETRGGTICFGGHVVPAVGAMKRDTADLTAFANSYLTAAEPVPRLPRLPRRALAGVAVPVIAAYPGAGPELVDAALDHGACGLVVEALGAGNMGDGMGKAVSAALDRGVPVAITSRVPDGEIALSYGGAGGGASLGDKGALPTGRLRAGQARMLLAAAVATGTEPATLFARFSA